MLGNVACRPDPSWVACKVIASLPLPLGPNRNTLHDPRSKRLVVTEAKATCLPLPGQPMRIAYTASPSFDMV